MPFSSARALLHADARLEPADGASSETAAARGCFSRVKTERHEDFRLLGWVAHAQRIKVGRQDADHAISFGCEIERASDNPRIAAKPAHPESIAEDHDIRARPAIFAGVDARPGTILTPSVSKKS